MKNETDETDTSVLAPFGRMIQKPQAKWIALVVLVGFMAAQYLGY